MNLVKLITEQFSDETLGKLSSQLGTDTETTGAAATAAVPTLLSALAGLASRGDGAKKLSGVLSGVDAGSLGNLAQLLGGDTGALFERGSGLLGSLFGDSMISAAAAAISRYSGINADTAKRLLAFLVPMILAKVAAQWRSQGGTVGALTGLFADQKRNIADAVPAGFSLADIPGLAGAGDAVRAAGQTTRRAAETAEAATGSMANWLLPLAVLIVGGFLLWNFLKPQPADNADLAQADKDAAKVTVMKPVANPGQPALPDMATVPDVAGITDDLKGILTAATDELAAIKDAASAEAAMPRLEELKSKLDDFRSIWTRLPEANRPALRQMIETQIGPLKQSAEQAATIPGLSDRVKSLINEIVQTLTELAAPTAPATPATTQ